MKIIEKDNFSSFPSRKTEFDRVQKLFRSTKFHCADCICQTASPLYSDLLLYSHVLVGHRLLKGHHTRLTRPDYLSLRLVLEGGEYVRYDGKLYLAEPGDLMIFLPRHDFEYAAMDSVPCVVRSIAVKGKLLDTFLEHSKLKNHCFIHLEKPDFFLTVFQRLYALFTAETASDPALNAGLVFQLLQKISGLSGPSQTPPLLQEIQYYIDRNPGGDLSLAALAGRFGRSTVAIGQLFRHHLKCSVHQYIIKCRMRHARELLEYQGLSVKETAGELGFGSQFNFSFRFKQYYGFPPRQCLRSTFPGPR